MRKRKVIAVGLVLMLAVFAAGCPKGAYHDAVVAEHDFKTAVQSFQQAEMQEFQNGRIDAATHKQLEGGVEKIGSAAQTLVSSLQSGANNMTVQQNFDTVSAAVTDLLNNGVLGIKNPQSQQILKALVESAQALLKNISSLLSVQPTVPAATKGGL